VSHVAVDGPFVGLLTGSNDTVRHGIVAPVVNGQVDAVVACAGKTPGKTNRLGPSCVTVPMVPIRRSVKASSSIFL